MISKHWDCRYIPGPRRGLYANRNHAALACRGTHIRTMDDDHEFPDEHCKAVQTSVESDPDSIWIFGEYHEEPNAFSKLYLPGEIQPRGFSNLPNNLDDCFAISDGACVYPKRIFENHRYLEIFKFGNLYLEFGARLKSLGYCIRYYPKTYIIHHIIPDSRSFNDENLQRKSAFLSAYLTYGIYFFNSFRKFECISYFFAISLLNILRPKYYSFNLLDFFQTWRLGVRYGDIFRSGQHNQMI